MTLTGLMQDRPLMISDILRFVEAAHPDREIVSRLVDEPDWRYDYAGLAERCRRGANMLRGLGVGEGDRVTTLAWNTHRHMELFYAAPGIGAVLHTANPRFSLDQLAYTIDHAGSRIVFYDRSFAGLIDDVRARLPAVERYVLLAEGYEALLAQASPHFDWPMFEENAGSFLCYTSGTTGDPKGVLYSHRSVVLHALAAGLNGALGFTAFDCIMPCQSLYHATAWGLPFVAAINGCKMVLPGHRFDGESLQQLIQSEGVTFSGGVPTIWTMYLDHLERSGESAGPLKQLVIGGSAVPRAMAEAFESRYGVTVRQIWGMTETSPLGVLSTPTPKLAAQAAGALGEAIWSRSGRLQFGIEVSIIDDDGRQVPADGNTAGALLVRGPWVVERYYRSDASACDAQGWFDTGDIATIDDCGFIRITDRQKDVIKSGGEWISSIDLENVAISCPGVKIAAVVGVAHAKWEERPILVLECHDGEAPCEAVVRAHLAPHIPNWWQPEAVIYAEVPLTSTGKIDKKALRERYKDCLSR